MILLYHKVHPDSPTKWWVTINDFYRQMSELQHKKVVYFDDYDITDPEMVVITFDGIYKNICEYAFPILKHFSYPFELFITSDHIGQKNEFDAPEPPAEFASLNDLEDLVANGGRLQWHSRTHCNLKNITDAGKIENELNVPPALRGIDKQGFKWFAYPYGEFNKDVVAATKKIFAGAVSCDQGNEDDMYTLNRVTVTNTTSFRKSKISCIITSYNYGAYLIDAVESVLRQTILPDLILISDDCSTDDTREIAENYVKKYPQLIRYNRNEKNLGIVDHFNKAVRLTSTGYVMILGADNRILSNYIEQCAATLDASENIGIAYTDFVLFGDRAKIIFSNFGEFRGKAMSESSYTVNFPEFDNRTESVKMLTEKNFIHGSSMYRRSAFDKAGGYHQSGQPEDHHLFMRMIECGFNAKKANNTLLEYRQHSPGQANNLVSVYQKASLYKQLYEEQENFRKTKTYRYAFIFYKIRRMSFRKLIKKVYNKIARRK